MPCEGGERHERPQRSSSANAPWLTLAEVWTPLPLSPVANCFVVMLNSIYRRLRSAFWEDTALFFLFFYLFIYNLLFKEQAT